MSESSTTPRATMRDQAVQAEEFMARVGLDEKKHAVYMTIGYVWSMSVYTVGDRREALVAEMGEPKRDRSSSSGVAVWEANPARPFLVRAYHWFKDEPCSTCGR